MQKQLLKGLLAFVILVVSFLSSKAQCKGNKVLVCTCQRTEFGCLWHCKCVPPSHARYYLQKGWTLSTPSDDITSNTTPSDQFSASVINSSSIDLALAESQSVSIKIYDATGRLVKTIANRKMPEGYHQIEWNNKDESGKAVPDGIYVLQIFANGKSETMKLSIMK